jgi:phosphatidate cytidylyltransferase
VNGLLTGATGFATGLVTTGPAPYVAGGLSLSGVAVGVSRRRELVQRWVVWVCAALLLGTADALGPRGNALLAIGIAVPCVVEYSRLVQMPRNDTCVLGAGVLLAVVLAHWQLPEAHAALALPLIASLPAVLEGDVRQGGRRAAYLLFGLLWIGALSALVTLGHRGIVLVVAVSVADVASWCAGKALQTTPFGSRRLSPLSPGKRVSGTVGGALGGVLVLALLGALTPPLVVAVALAAPLGDLTESMVKRAAGVKDAGTWLPGFGGMLDRVDSLLFALAIALVLS